MPDRLHENKVQPWYNKTIQLLDQIFDHISIMNLNLFSSGGKADNNCIYACPQ